MKHDMPDHTLTEREAKALEKSIQKRELIEWLRTQAANRSGKTHWYVVRTKGDSVEDLAEEMEKHGIKAYCPMCKVVKRLPRKREKVTVETALFSRYLFVHLPDFEAAFLGVMTFDGVDCLLGTQHGPSPIPNEIVERIQIEAGDLEPDTSKLFKRGDWARVLTGPFAMFHAELQQDEGNDSEIDIEIAILGRMTPCRIGVDDLEKLD